MHTTKTTASQGQDRQTPETSNHLSLTTKNKVSTYATVIDTQRVPDTSWSFRFIGPVRAVHFSPLCSPTDWSQNNY